jgi:hypothetical protein
MKPQLLLIVDSDPRNSPRPAEAVRIAAGVGAWERLRVILYLHGPAVALLDPESDQFPDGDNYARYLPLVRETDQALRVQAGASLPPGVSEPGEGFSLLDAAELARLTAESTWVIRF